MPKEKHHDLDYLVDQLDWEANVNPRFQGQPLPGADCRGRFGLVGARRPLDRLRQGGRQELFSAKELTVNPGVKVTVKDNGAYGLITVQGTGRLGRFALQTPAMIRFGELTEDEVFVTHDAARQGWCSKTPAASRW